MSEARVLIVDDNRDFADGLAEFLEMFGHQVDTAFTGESGIEAAAGKAYDVILMDVGLPGVNGVESLLSIREANADVRCFLMTGYSSDHIARQGIEAGAVEILTKPIDVKEVLRRINEIDRAP